MICVEVPFVIEAHENNSTMRALSSILLAFDMHILYRYTEQYVHDSGVARIVKAFNGSELFNYCKDKYTLDDLLSRKDQRRVDYDLMRNIRKEVL